MNPKSLISRRFPALVAALLLPLLSAGAMHPDWARNANVYEVNVRQFSEAGDFKAVEDYLPEIKALGCDIVWLMPIHPIGEKNRKGPMGSYYSVKDYKGINPEFGDAEDFRSLVDRAHELGMYVILDWVANHTAWDHPWTETDPDFYTRDGDGDFKPPVEDWSDVIELDFDNREMRREMIDAMVYWVEEFGVDGYRCDVAGEVPLDFWQQAREALDDAGTVFMLAEDGGFHLHDKAFEMSYGWPHIGLLREIAKGERNANDLYALDRETERNLPRGCYRMKFLTNHDENSWHATVQDDFGDAERVLFAYTVVSPGMPLVYTGQEAGLDKQLEFFDRDPVEWREHPNRAFITTLLQLKKRNPALWNGADGGRLVRFKTNADEQVYALMREKDGHRVVALLNLSPDRVEFAVSDDRISGTYTDVLSGKPTRLRSRSTLSLDPWGFRILEGAR